MYYPELEEAGLYLRRDEKGQVVTSPGKIRSVAANLQGNSGVPFMDLRRKQVIKAGIPRLEETAVLQQFLKRVLVLVLKLFRFEMPGLRLDDV